MSHHMLTKDAILDMLRTVIDPELDVNIVDLGLIYDITISETKIVVHMTLTTPGCPLMSHLINEVAVALHRLAPHVESDIKLVWDPPWHPQMMSESVKQKLGWHEQTPPPADDEIFCDITNKRLNNEQKK